MTCQKRPGGAALHVGMGGGDATGCGRAPKKEPKKEAKKEAKKDGDVKSPLQRQGDLVAPSLAGDLISLGAAAGFGILEVVEELFGLRVVRSEGQCALGFGAG